MMNLVCLNHILLLEYKQRATNGFLNLDLITASLFRSFNLSSKAAEIQTSQGLVPALDRFQRQE